MGLLAKNAVPINGLKTTEKNVEGTYAMAAPVMRNGEITGTAILTVEIRTGHVVGIDTYDQVHATSTRKKNGVSHAAQSAAALQSTNHRNGSTSTDRSSTMTISDFLDLVKDTHPDILSKDMLEYYKHKDQPEGYWAKRKLFSMAETEDAQEAKLSSDLAELGNEASMRAYGIKKFTEDFYFPIKSWGGVLNKSSASGTSNKSDNRAMRQSFTKRIRNNASNAMKATDTTGITERTKHTTAGIKTEGSRDKTGNLFCSVVVRVIEIKSC